MSDTVNLANDRMLIVPDGDIERQREAAENAKAKADRYAEGASRSYTRLRIHLDALDTVFGVGGVAELRRRVEDLTEGESETRYHATEAVAHLENVIDAMRQRDTVYRRQVATIRGHLAADNARLRDELAVAKVKAEEYGWLRDMLQGTLDHLERSAKRRGVRVPGMVGNLRRGLKVSDARVRTASDAS